MALIGWWWALFLATEVLAWQSLRLQGDALVQFQDGGTARGLSIIGAAVMIAALAGWGQVLRAVTTEQHGSMYGGRAAI